MTNNYLMLAATILIPDVFIALGIERTLIYLGVIAGPEFTIGAIAFCVFELALGLMIAVGWKLRYTAGLLASKRSAAKRSQNHTKHTSTPCCSGSFDGNKNTDILRQSAVNNRL